MSALIFGAAAFFRSDAGSLPVLFQKIADVIDGSRNALPEWIVTTLHENADALREHAPELRLAGAEAGRALAHIIIGMVAGAALSRQEVRPS